MDRVLDDTTADALAERLRSAERTRTPIAPLTTKHPDMTAADAYAIQERIVATRTAEGERIRGWKLGLTSAAMQLQLDVDQPDYGPILSGWLLPDGAEVRVADLIQPRVEAEIAFILGAPLQGPGVTADDVRAATDALAPALEVIDSRIRDWKLSLPDTIADLASTARVIVGGARIALDDSFEPRLLGAELERDGLVVQTGTGAAALGDPLAAVAWAANTLGPLGVTMEPGQVVMTGALHASVTVRPGEHYRASIDRLGSVELRFG